MSKVVELEIKDSTNLTDADWAEINKLKQAYGETGSDGLSKALAVLSEGNPAQYLKVMAAFFPHQVREAVRDEMAANGIDEQDLREMADRLERPTRDQ